jgi:hypothetical protein
MQKYPGIILILGVVTLNPLLIVGAFILGAIFYDKN